MTVEAGIHPSEGPGQKQRQQDEIDRDNRIGDEGIEGLVGKVIGVIERIAPLLETSLADYRAVVEVNQTGCFLGLRVAGAAIVRAGGGAIVNVSSTGGLEGVPRSIAYAASKHAVKGMTMTAAIELGPLGVRVNAVHPGGVDTPMLGLSAEARTEGFRFLPLGRIAEPAEIARVVAFLASDEASYMTGSSLLVDGGSMAGPLGWNMD